MEMQNKTLEMQNKGSFIIQKRFVAQLINNFHSFLRNPFNVYKHLSNRVDVKKYTRKSQQSESTTTKEARFEHLIFHLFTLMTKFLVTRLFDKK
jgi:hypothetical protein